MRVLVLQHIACEPPGVYEDVLHAQGAELVRIEVDESEPLPEMGDFDGIVAMGGPMSVNDEADRPWLVAEKRLIANAVRDGVPYWGVCLGVQLLAASLGARVYPSAEPEVGLLPVFLTDAALVDPVFAGLPVELLTLQWHGDTFDLPAGAVLLASSPHCPNQAFRVGRHAYGLQFHLEVSPELAREWAAIPAYRDSLERTLGPGALDRLIAELEANAALLASAARDLFERWLGAVRASSSDDRNRAVRG
jgi:GMP synthase (glutamine-hydrolysing)